MVYNFKRIIGGGIAMAKEKKILIDKNIEMIRKTS